MTGDRGVLAVIPARYASTRLPEKVILDIAGKPLVQHVYDRVRRSGAVTACVVATDDDRVRAALEPFGTEVVMTSPDHQSGTDRVAEVARDRDERVVVNVQGDEPRINPDVIDLAVRPLLDDPSVTMSTLSCPIDAADVDNPDVVKVVTDQQGRALYFSRAPIPVDRDRTGRAVYRKHVGLYVYRRDFLLDYASWSPTPLETTERLEQLRVLEHGFPILVVETEYDSMSVDSQSDLDRVRQMFNQMTEQE
jgi:3-deoxy-manno-octulosonate cytidylyltransferase (CMP-KDO synthetase)